MNWPLMTGDTEHLKQAAAIVARANDWDIPTNLSAIFNWPLEQFIQFKSIASKLEKN